MRRTRLFKAMAGAATAIMLAPLVWVPGAGAAGGPNLALGKTASVSSVTGGLGAANLNDANAATYWESVNNTFPQWAQIDLSTAASVDQVVLKLPAGWGARTQTLTVQASTDGTAFTTVAASQGYAFSPASANTVTINFTATTLRYVRVTITANTGWPAGQLSEFEVYGTAGPTGNLAQGRPTTETSHVDIYDSSRAVDGNPATYWESANNAFPQSLTADLGSAVSINRVVLKLPATWGTRTQTLSIQGSTTGTSYSDLAGSAAYTFNPAVAANSVTITFTAATARYVRVAITANTGWPAGQIGELEVYAPTGPADTTPPSVPGTLSYTHSGTTITLSWGASADNPGGSGMAGYNVYRDGALLQAIGNVTTFTDTQPVTATVSYYVRARDNAGNLSGNSNTVTRPGAGDTTPPTAPGTLSYTVSGNTITLNWGPATDSGGSGLAGYNVYRNGSLIASLATVMSYQDTQPPTATVSYFVRARDGAGNIGPASNTVTRTGSQPPGCSNAAAGKPVTATGSVFGFVPANAVDGLVTTYWEGTPVYPQNLTVALGTNHVITAINVKLNPDPAWGTRTQNFQILGREQSSGTFTTLAAAQNYVFTQGSNVVNIPVSASVADVQLRFNSNTGAPSGQVAELEVCGTPGPADTQPPTPPANPRVSNLLCDSVTFAWDASTDNVGVAFYDVYHDGQFMTAVTSLSANLTVVPGATWGLYVNARDAAGNVSQASTTVTISPPLCQPDPTPPTAPTQLTGTATGTTVNLSWTAATDNIGVRAYDIFRGTTLAGTVTGNPPATTFIDSGLTPNTTYQYNVRARDAAGNNSANSNTATITTGAGCLVCTVTQLATDTGMPWGLVTLPDGTILYARRDQHDIIHLNPATGVKTNIGTVPNVQSTDGEGGLLGLEISSTFATDRYLYIMHTSPADNRIVRMKVENNQLVQTSHQVLLTGILRNKFHNGGRLRFGPDGKLYAATGDAQNGDHAQNLSNLAGKILRLNPDGTVPADNPFGTYVWSYGHRNPQGLAFDSQGRLWQQEFGNSIMDETNLIVRGGNYGWPACEGTAGNCGVPGYIAPKLTYPVAEGSCSGIAIVRDVLYVACQRGTRLYRAEISGSALTNVQAYLVGTYGRLRTVEPAPSGGIWLTTTNNSANDRIMHVALG